MGKIDIEQVKATLRKHADDLREEAKKADDAVETLERLDWLRMFPIEAIA